VKNSILDAVGRLLVRYGYKKMTVSDIANEAGIGKGTVYLYFSSKEEVALSWFERIHGELVREMESIARSGAEPICKVREMLVERVMFSFDHLQVFMQSLDELFAAVRPALLDKRECYHAEHAAILARVLREGCESGVFEIDDIGAAVEALVLAMNSLLPYSLSTSQLGERDQIRTKADHLAGLMLRGLLRQNPR